MHTFSLTSFTEGSSTFQRSLSSTVIQFVMAKKNNNTMSSQGNVYTQILVIVHILTLKYKGMGRISNKKKTHVNVHTLVKCTYGREALRDEDIHRMNWC